MFTYIKEIINAFFYIVYYPTPLFTNSRNIHSFCKMLYSIHFVIVESNAIGPLKYCENNQGLNLLLENTYTR